MNQWEDDKRVAAAILQSRPLRRKWLSIFLIVDLAVLVLGLWVLDDWLSQSLLWFIIWWTICGLLTLWVVLFAIFDVLCVIKEERQ